MKIFHNKQCAFFLILQYGELIKFYGARGAC